jgi:hypothetical protein
MEPLPVLLLNLRNLLAVALLIWLLVDRMPSALRAALGWPAPAAHLAGRRTLH